MSNLCEHEVTAYFEPFELLNEGLEVWLALDVWSYGSHAKILVNSDNGACCKIDGASPWI